MTAPVLHLGIGKPTKCRSCGAEIVFAKSTTGKDAPFQRDENGLWTIRNGIAVYLGTPDPQPAQLELGKTLETPEPRFTSHFASCPNAKNWRKR